MQRRLTVFHVRWHVHVGRGSFAVVKRAVRKSDGHQFAIKVRHIHLKHPTGADRSCTPCVLGQRKLTAFCLLC